MRIVNILEFRQTLLSPFSMLVTETNRLPSVALKLGNIAALDVGSKRIGIASTTDLSKQYISPILTLERKYPPMSEASITKLGKLLQEVVTKNNIIGLVVGFPITPTNQISSFAQDIISLVDQLDVRYENPELVELYGQQLISTFWDERNSSVGSRHMAKSMSSRLSVVKKYKDSFAACLILEGYLAHNYFRT